MRSPGPFPPGSPMWALVGAQCGFPQLCMGTGWVPIALCGHSPMGALTGAQGGFPQLCMGTAPRTPGQQPGQGAAVWGSDWAPGWAPGWGGDTALG